MKKINYYLILLITIGISCSIVYAVDFYCTSREVSYDNSNSGLISDNVQDALDELFNCASSYNSINENVIELLNITEENAGFHNAIFRGKNITDYYMDGTLYTRISNGTFNDLYIGDYIVQNGINWRIAGFDIYLKKGDNAFMTHHAVIIPDTGLTSARMNSSDTTIGGYVGSEMYTVTLPNVLETYINPVFGSHVLEYRNLLSNSMDNTRANRTSFINGAASDWGWYTRKLDLMNEVQVFGTIAWSSSGIEVGSDNTQFPLFRLRPIYINVQRNCYWLRNIVSETHFVDVELDGFTGLYGASLTNNTFTNQAFGVRPYFYID